MRQEDKPQVQQHYDYLDGLRAFLALYVVAHHGWLLTSWHSPKGSLSPLYTAIFSRGHDAVIFFIILSGFCLMLPVLKNGLHLPQGASGFFKRRAWRILPPYYFALGLSLLWNLISLPSPSTEPWHDYPTLHGVITHVLLIQNFSNTDMYLINGVCWSIAVEWQIYFAFPLFLACWRKAGFPVTVLVSFLLSVLFLYITQRLLGVDASLEFLCFFVFGMAAAYLSFSPKGEAKRHHSLPWGWFTLAGLALVFVAGVVVRRYPHLPSFVTSLSFAVFATLVLIYVPLRPESWLRKLLNLRPLVWIGTFAYSLYLTHKFAIDIAREYVLLYPPKEPNITCAWIILLSVPASVAVAYLFFLYCERPYLIKRNRKIVHAS